MSTRAIGRPEPEIDLDRVTMSGSIPISSNEKKGPVRPHPTWMSSMMSRIPWRLQMSSRLHPLARRRVYAALALSGLHADGSGLGEAASGRGACRERVWQYGE